MDIDKVTNEVLKKINQECKIDRITREVMSVLNDLVCNDEKWITIKPHGEDSKDYRRLKLEDGETPKQAIDRVYKKQTDKKELSEKTKKEIEKIQRKIDLVGKDTMLGRKYQKQIDALKGEKEIEEKKEPQKNKSKQILFSEYKKAKEVEKKAREKWSELSEKAREVAKTDKKYQELEKKYQELQKQISETNYYTNRERWQDLISQKNKIANEKENRRKEISDKLGVYDAQENWSKITDETNKVKVESFDKATEKIKDRIKEMSKSHDKILKNIENSIDLKEYNNLLEKFDKLKEEEKIKWKEISDTPFRSEEREDARKKWSAVANKKNNLKKELGQYTLKFVELVNKELQIEDSIKEFNFDATSMQKDNAERLQNALSGVIPKDVYSNKNMKMHTHSGRAYQSGATINVSKNAKIGTLIHEMMHNVEEDNSTMLMNSLAFANYRTQGEKQISLRKLTGNSYKANEICKKDNFFNPYCGKFYNLAGGKNQQYVNCNASEIMSMGVEELFTNPLEFAKKDREYFDFVISNLRGEI